MSYVNADFYTAVLQQIGAPASQNNIAILFAWQRGEGGAATWNPLNTTSYEPGSTWYNTFGSAGQYHVLNYPSEQSGIGATSATMLNGHYSAIVSAFRADAPGSYWKGTPAISQELGVWGTGTRWFAWMPADPPSSSPPTPVPVIPVPPLGGTTTMQGSSSIAPLLFIGGGVGLIGWWVYQHPASASRRLLSASEPTFG